MATHTHTHTHHIPERIAPLGLPRDQCGALALRRERVRLRTVMVEGATVGRITDVILDRGVRRLCGFAVACGDGDRFLPLAAVAAVGPSGIEIESVLHLVDEIEFYRRDGLSLNDVLGRWCWEGGWTTSSPGSTRATSRHSCSTRARASRPEDAAGPTPTRVAAARGRLVAAADRDLGHLDGLSRPVPRVAVDGGDGVDDVLTAGDLPEDGVLAVEPRAGVRRAR